MSASTIPTLLQPTPAINIEFSPIKKSTSPAVLIGEKFYNLTFYERASPDAPRTVMTVNQKEREAFILAIQQCHQIFQKTHPDLSGSQAFTFHFEKSSEAQPGFLDKFMGKKENPWLFEAFSYRPLSSPPPKKEKPSVLTKI